MTISVIIPTYNRPQLFECLDAIYRQTIPGSKSYSFTNFEVIVVAREPNDEFVQKMEAFRQRTFKTPEEDDRLVILFYNKPGNGPAKNYAATYAKGEYLVFTDDDCIPASTWLWHLFKPVLNVNADIVSGQCLPADKANPYIVAHQGAIMYQLDNKNPIAGSVCDWDSIEASVGTTMNILVKKEVFTALGGFDPVFATHYGDDFDFNQKWAADTTLRKVYTPYARVYHNHKLTFKKLCQLSFRMGMGAKKCKELILARLDKTLERILQDFPDWFLDSKNFDVSVHPRRSEYIDIIRYIRTTPYLKQCSWFVKNYAAVLTVLMQEIRRIGYKYAVRFPDKVSKIYD